MTRIFVAGAAGVIGRRLLPQLLTAGYQVIGTTRPSTMTAQLQAQGAQAVIVDVLDPAALARVPSCWSSPNRDRASTTSRSAART